MNASRPIDHARAGNLDALRDLASTDLRAAYLWLLVAHDLEHEDAQDALGDLEEHCNELKYDDDGLVRLGIQLELASAYLRGKLGLDVDLALAERHVEAAMELAPAVDGGPEQVLRDLLVDLEGDAAELIRARLASEPFHAIRRAVDRVQRLHEVKAPEAILDAECARLRGAVARALEIVRSTI